MIVRVREVKEGHKLLKDVMLPSKRPLMYKNTVLNNEKIEVLKAFLIESVEVEKVDKARVEVEKEELQEVVVEGFIEKYLKTVDHYKQLFLRWQSGASVHVTEVRKIFVPLLESALSDNNYNFFLSKFSRRTEYMYHHAVSTGLYSGYIAKKMGLPQGEVIQIALAGILSDAGMSRVPLKILNKETKLTREEYAEVKNHPTHGFNLLQQSSSLKKYAQLAILQHHERLDGSGYPGGEMGDMIHLYSRIVAVADTFHAMCTDNKYRVGQSPYKVYEVIRYDEFGKFDVRVVETLRDCIINFGIGNTVILSNNVTGKIVFMNQTYKTRPIIQAHDTGEMINLITRRDLFIKEVY